jgi:cell division protein FtsL
MLLASVVVLYYMYTKTYKVNIGLHRKHVNIDQQGKHIQSSYVKLHVLEHKVVPTSPIQKFMQKKIPFLNTCLTG